MYLDYYKPNYNKKQIKEYSKKFKFKFKEYGNISFNDILKWCKSLNEYSNKINENILIDVDIYDEDSGGCGCGPSIIEFTPYFIRYESDKEYNKRIKSEEDEYNKMVKEIKSKEYIEDLKEFNRIKEKYNL